MISVLPGKRTDVRGLQEGDGSHQTKLKQKQVGRA